MGLISCIISTTDACSQ